VSRPDILFQFESTDASTDLTDGHLSFVAPDGGVSMINYMTACGSSGGTANFFRVYHCGPDETPAVGNMIIRAGANSSAKALTSVGVNMKIIMNPGDKIFCQLHSGDGITLTMYGIIPDSMTSIASSEIASGRDSTQQVSY
tara:strand:+ start:274 stop:696 length:423 start_codon:yes stop_codon:yes gene_type:complete